MLDLRKPRSAACAVVLNILESATHPKPNRRRRTEVSDIQPYLDAAAADLARAGAVVVTDAGRAPPTGYPQWFTHIMGATASLHKAGDLIDTVGSSSDEERNQFAAQMKELDFLNAAGQSLYHDIHKGW